VKLLQWSSVDTYYTVNQYPLLAAVVILNIPYIEDKQRISNDLDTLTHQFFSIVEQEIGTNSTLRDIAKKVGLSRPWIFRSK
jgi:hypothetical protein